MHLWLVKFRWKTTLFSIGMQISTRLLNIINNPVNFTESTNCTHVRSQQSQTVEKWPQPSFLITWYLPLYKSPIFTGWYPPIPHKIDMFMHYHAVFIYCKQYSLMCLRFIMSANWRFTAIRYLSDVCVRASFELGPSVSMASYLNQNSELMFTVTLT